VLRRRPEQSWHPLDKWAWRAQDFEASATWFAKAAAHNTGVAYFKGTGVALDFELADRWFRKAAAQGQNGWLSTRSRKFNALARADAAAARSRG
jgi:TPR repeat protein